MKSRMPLLQSRIRLGKKGLSSATPVEQAIRCWKRAAGFCALAAILAAGHPVLGQNRVLKLDGNGSYVELPSDIFKDLTQATVEVWAKWAEFAAFSRVFEFGAGYHSVSLFNHATTNDLRFNIYPRFAKSDPAAMNTATARGLLRSNEWIHLAAVSGPGGMALYANGRLVARHTNITTFADIKAPHTNVLGRGLAGNPTDRFFRGELDEVRVWDHRRTVEQIRDLMFKRLTGREEGLVGLWNFDDGSAKDSSYGTHDGKLMGKARIGNTDLDLSLAVLPPPPNTNPAPATAMPLAATNPIAPVPLAAATPGDSGSAVWWIAGALCALVALLAWLVLMLRRSGLGSEKLVGAGATAALAPGEKPSGAGGDSEIKERALAELTSFAKESLVQGLYSQRAALLETHQQAQKELADLEARVVALHLPERIEVYEKRIAELEAKLQSRNDELHELTQATLQLLRQKLEEEKQKQGRSERLN